MACDSFVVEVYILLVTSIFGIKGPTGLVETQEKIPSFLQVTTII